MRFLLILMTVLLFGEEIPKKIIAIGPGALRMVVYLQAQDKVVGIEKREHKFIHARPYILAHKELLRLPSIGMGGPNFNINLEAIKKLNPDLIVAGFIDEKRAKNIEEKTGIKVIKIRYGKLGNAENRSFQEALLKLGRILGKEKRAKEIINYLNSLKFEKINTDKKVYIGGVAFKGIHGLTSTIRDFLPFKLNGLKNIVNSRAQIYISEEFLYKTQPDIIFVDESALGLINFNRYKYLKAFKNHQVYGLLPYNNYMTNIASAYLDAFYIQKVFGKNINMDKKAKEIYEFFVGKNVYPEMKKKFGGFRKF